MWREMGAVNAESDATAGTDFWFKQHVLSCLSDAEKIRRRIDNDQLDVGKNDQQFSTENSVPKAQSDCKPNENACVSAINSETGVKVKLSHPIEVNVRMVNSERSQLAECSSSADKRDQNTSAAENFVEYLSSVCKHDCMGSPSCSREDLTVISTSEDLCDEEPVIERGFLRLKQRMALEPPKKMTKWRRFKSFFTSCFRPKVI